MWIHRRISLLLWIFHVNPEDPYRKGSVREGHHRSTLRCAGSFPAKVHRPGDRFYSRHDDCVLTTETANRNWWLRIHHRHRPSEVESLSGIPVSRGFLSVKGYEKLEIHARAKKTRIFLLIFQWIVKRVRLEKLFPYIMEKVILANKSLNKSLNPFLFLAYFPKW